MWLGVLEQHLLILKFDIEVLSTQLRMFQFYVLVKAAFRPIGFIARAALVVAWDLSSYPSDAFHSWLVRYVLHRFTLMNFFLEDGWDFVICELDMFQRWVVVRLTKDIDLLVLLLKLGD